MAARVFSLDELVNKSTKDLLTELRQARFQPTEPLPPVAPPAVVFEPPPKRVMDRPEYDEPELLTPLPYRDTAQMPDDPNLEDFSPRRRSDAPLAPEHEALERDYYSTLDGGLADDVPQLGNRGIPNQQDDSFDPADVPPPFPTTGVPSQLKLGAGRIWANTDPAVFQGVAHEIYRGQVVFDAQSKEWTVFTYSVPSNQVVLQDPQGFRTKTALNRFLGRELAACPYELGDLVAIPDPTVGGEREAVVVDVSELAQCLYVVVEGKRRQVRFTRARLVSRPTREEEDNAGNGDDQTLLPDL